MRLHDCTFTDQNTPRTAASITVRLLDLETQIQSLMVEHHETTGALALAVNDLRTVRGRLAHAASFSGSNDPRIPQAVPGIPFGMEPPARPR
ncbi:hypothetical protein [Limnohabitans sp.]|uniref:hypothetical protein n=1 Tax=Limnohabitans sp. TaxID=1907725 RepID=UPI0025C3D449|nr:hypothetical protein [Limnohabitans sp.]